MEWDPAITSLVGGAIGISIAKFFITSSMKKIEEIPEKLSEIKSQLSSMQVKLDLMDRLHALCQEHDRKITSLESQNQVRAMTCKT